MKKILSLFTTITVITALTSCSFRGNTAKSRINTAENVEIVQTMYGQHKINAPTDLEIYFNIGAAGENYCLIYRSADGRIKMSTLDDELTFSESTVLSEERAFTCYADFTDNRITLLILPLDSEDRVSGYKIADFSLDGQLISETDINSIDEYYNGDVPIINGIINYGEGWIVSVGNELLLIDRSGNITDNQTSDGIGLSVGRTADGKYILTEHASYRCLDGQTLKLPMEPTYFSEGLTDCHGIMYGNGGFSAYLLGSDAVYGLQPDGSVSVVLHFSASELKNNFSQMCALRPGEFFAAMYNTSTNSTEFSLLTRRPDDFSDSRQEIVLAMSGGDSSLNDLAVEFNHLNDKYKVTVKSKIFDTTEMRNSILSDDAPDLICLGSNTEVTHLYNMGALADMSIFLDGDTGIDRDELLPNVIEAYTFNGGIYSLPTEFCLNILIANREVLGEEYRNWTIDDFIDTVNAHEGDMFVENYCTEPDALLDYILCGDWIDEENAECHFDSDDFIKALKFCRDSQSLAVPYDFDNPNVNSGMDFQFSLKNKKALLNRTVQGDFSIISNLGSIGMTYSDITILGIPSNGITMSGTEYSITSNGDCPEGAWEFLSYLMSDEVQTRELFYTSIPINIKALEARAENFSCDPAEMTTIESSIGFRGNDGTEVNFNTAYNESLTTEEMEDYLDLIKGCRKSEFGNYSITEIAHDEFGRFINGEISAEECAAAIQNRAQIYISENS